MLEDVWFKMLVDKVVQIVKKEKNTEYLL